ncbi:MAG: hypothetical protein L0I76_32705 [Pseudonocardia sp.]|nr:hypothetical protein [Pseudonocardia sp.]
MEPIVADHSAHPGGVLWRLSESGRQLDANVLNLSARQTIGVHAEPELDVLLLIVAGAGTMATEEGPLALVPGELIWLPRTSSRSITAGVEGLAYLTVHRRRPGLQIGSRNR